MEKKWSHISYTTLLYSTFESPLDTSSETHSLSPTGGSSNNCCCLFPCWGPRAARASAGLSLVCPGPPGLSQTAFLNENKSSWEKAPQSCVSIVFKIAMGHAAILNSILWILEVSNDKEKMYFRKVLIFLLSWLLWSVSQLMQHFSNSALYFFSSILLFREDSSWERCPKEPCLLSLSSTLHRAVANSDWLPVIK